MAVLSEQAVQFGPRRQLVGIVTLPGEPDPDRPAILIPNTGVEHRVGPNRLHVHLCRAFARLGFATMRLDLSGMGDSGVSRMGSSAQVVADQRAAMDELERMGVARRFIPIGLCSGANDVHWLTGADPRVVASAFIDHYTYPTWRYRLIFLAQRLFDPRRLLNFIERKLRELRQSDKEKFRGEDVDYLEQPPQERFNADLGRFMQRQLPLFFLFTGEYQHLYNYRNQLLDSCPALRRYDRYDLHYFPRCDHTFTQAHMREKLISALERWLVDRVLPHLSAA
ncbi:MAG TPA: hypothetical protein VM369_10145 [Candidatus Binatia bacterium]|nr:hypothetical protein [Candidatus Binatia bacterium]